MASQPLHCAPAVNGPPCSRFCSVAEPRLRADLQEVNPQDYTRITQVPRAEMDAWLRQEVNDERRKLGQGSAIISISVSPPGISARIRCMPSRCGAWRSVYE